MMQWRDEIKPNSEEIEIEPNSNENEIEPNR
jgi:hypothetical protein